jgi:PAS domain-containing protein
MTTPERSKPSGVPDPAEASELSLAAADLDALATAYDECSRSLEELEAAVDLVLDDSSTCALVLDERLRVLAVSRGMASVLGVKRSIIGARVASVLPPNWPDLPAALADLRKEDGWRSLPVGTEGAELRLRRATDDDRPGIYAARYSPCAT